LIEKEKIMIEAYYNLKRSPFAKDIHPEDIFVSQEKNGE
jgi:hypothetical protein